MKESKTNLYSLEERRRNRPVDLQIKKCEEVAEECRALLRSCEAAFQGDLQKAIEILKAVPL